MSGEAYSDVGSPEWKRWIDRQLAEWLKLAECIADATRAVFEQGGNPMPPPEEILRRVLTLCPVGSPITLLDVECCLARMSRLGLLVRRLPPFAG